MRSEGRGRKEHGAEGEMALEQTESSQRVLHRLVGALELGAEAENEAEGRRLRSEAMRLNQERAGIELSFAEKGEIPWSGGESERTYRRN